jgi:sigma-E factor negative regulatory protein RseB
MKHVARSPARMNQCLWLAFFLAVFFHPGEQAQAQTTQPEQGPPEVPAVEAAAPSVGWEVWWGQMQQAVEQANFQGTMVSGGEGVFRSARVWQYWDEGQRYQRLETLDGQARRVLSHNHRVMTQWLQARHAMLEQTAESGAWPGWFVWGGLPPHRAGMAALRRFYHPHWLGHGRMAGYEAQGWYLKPRDRHRHGMKIWAERRSGLPLRVDWVGPAGEILASSAFSEVTMGVAPRPQEVLEPMRRLEGFYLEKPQVLVSRLSEEGWALLANSLPPGFELLHCLRRTWPAGASQGRHSESQPLQTLQLMFADGLSAVSVFIEPFDERRHALARHRPMGATRTWMARQGPWWLTAVGDAPEATLRALVQAVVRQPEK